jgi:hypothetical protein
MKSKNPSRDAMRLTPLMKMKNIALCAQTQWRKPRKRKLVSHPRENDSLKE